MHAELFHGTCARLRPCRIASHGMGLWPAFYAGSRAPSATAIRRPPVVPVQPPPYMHIYSRIYVRTRSKEIQATNLALINSGLFLRGETKMRPQVILVVTLALLGVLAALPLGKGSQNPFMHRLVSFPSVRKIVCENASLQTVRSFDTALFIPQTCDNYNRLWYKKRTSALYSFLLVVATILNS